MPREIPRPPVVGGPTGRIGPLKGLGDEDHDLFHRNRVEPHVGVTAPDGGQHRQRVTSGGDRLLDRGLESDPTSITTSGGPDCSA